MHRQEHCRLYKTDTKRSIGRLAPRSSFRRYRLESVLCRRNKRKYYSLLPLRDYEWNVCEPLRGKRFHTSPHTPLKADPQQFLHLNRRTYSVTPDLIRGPSHHERRRSRNHGCRLKAGMTQELPQPTDPSREIPSSFCASTANSIGSCWSTSRAKPLTINATAASASRPRDMA